MADRFALDERRALVTGGSLGIGRAIATAFAERGADVAIQYEPTADAAAGQPDAAEDVVSAAKATNRRSVALAADLASGGEGRRCVEDARTALGGLDILVICASVQVRGDILTATAEETARQVAVNFAATVELLQAALPAMAASGWGRVLAIGSVNAHRPDPELAVYAALKAAQHNLVANLARTYAPWGVTLNTLSPGLVATERNRSRRTDAAAWERIEGEANPMRRAGGPEDMIGAALLFCSDAGAFITGADLPVAGGGQL